MVPADDWVWVDELGRWGLDFDGSDDYVIQSREFGGGLVGDFAISLWIQTTTTSGPLSAVGVYEDGFTGGVEIGLNTIDGNGLDFGSLRYYIRDSSGNSDSMQVLSPSDWRDGIPHCHTLWRCGSITKYYIDAIEQSLAAVFGNDDLSAASIAFTRPMAFGARNVRGTAGLFADIAIFDPLIHNRALSPAEIQILANPADPMLGGLVLPPKRKYYAIHSTTRRRLSPFFCPLFTSSITQGFIK